MLDLGTLRINVEVNDNKAKQELETLDGSIQKTSKSTGVLAGLGKKLVQAFALEEIIRGVVRLGKAALQAAADYEQLEGATKKIFGEEAAEEIIKNSETAYLRAGMSANTYLEKVTSLSGGMVNALNGDTKKAAQYSDQLMVDISDMANMYGTSIEETSDVIQAMFRGNYQTLDNLWGGAYKGTKTGMQEMIDDANAFAEAHGLAANLTIDSQADIAKAIEYTNQRLHVTGTTAAEAEKTMSGSLGMLKASWGDFLTALGKGEGISEAMNNVVSSLGIAAKNILPTIGNIAKGLLDSVMEMVPSFFSGKWSSTVTSIIGNILSYIPTFVSNLGDMISNIADNVGNLNTGKMISTAFNLIIKCVVGIVKAIPKVLGAIAKLVGAMFKAFFNTDWKQVGKDILNSLWEGLKNLWKSITDWVSEKVKWIKDKFTIDLGENVSGGKLADSQGGIPKRIGLREVPYDNYPALLHKGETILTAAETNQYRRYINGELPAQRAVATAVPDKATFNLFVDGRKFAEIVAPYMSNQINLNTKRANRKLGVV